VDLFAVRQSPGNGADLDFEGVIKWCTAVILVAVSLPEVAAIGEENRVEIVDLPAHVRGQLAFCRVWCLVELMAALRYGKPLIMRAGHAEHAGDAYRPSSIVLIKKLKLYGSTSSSMLHVFDRPSTQTR
jgi:hypothetical protein